MLKISAGIKKNHNHQSKYSDFNICTKSVDCESNKGKGWRDGDMMLRHKPFLHSTVSTWSRAGGAGRGYLPDIWSNYSSKKHSHFLHVHNKEAWEEVSHTTSLYHTGLCVCWSCKLVLRSGFNSVNFKSSVVDPLKLEPCLLEYFSEVRNKPQKHQIIHTSVNLLVQRKEIHRLF